jgi:hypothetical protein
MVVRAALTIFFSILFTSCLFLSWLTSDPAYQQRKVACHVLLLPQEDQLHALLGSLKSAAEKVDNIAFSFGKQTSRAEKLGKLMDSLINYRSGCKVATWMDQADRFLPVAMFLFGTLLVITVSWNNQRATISNDKAD